MDNESRDYLDSLTVGQTFYVQTDGGRIETFKVERLTKTLIIHAGYRFSKKDGVLRQEGSTWSRNFSHIITKADDINVAEIKYQERLNKAVCTGIVLNGINPMLYKMTKEQLFAVKDYCKRLLGNEP